MCVITISVGMKSSKICWVRANKFFDRTLICIASINRNPTIHGNKQDRQKKSSSIVILICMDGASTTNEIGKSFGFFRTLPTNYDTTIDCLCVFLFDNFVSIDHPSPPSDLTSQQHKLQHHHRSSYIYPITRTFQRRRKTASSLHYKKKHLLYPSFFPLLLLLL